MHPAKSAATLCPHCGKDGVGEKTGRCLVCGYDARSAVRARHSDGTSYPVGTPFWVRLAWALFRPLNRWIERHG